MPLVLEKAVVSLVSEILGAEHGATPGWLLRPGRGECGSRWPLVQAIYAELEPGRTLPESMPPRERRKVDAVLVVAQQPPRILEVDETQHFNAYRAATLAHYAGQVPLAFDPSAWIERCEAKKRLEGGGFARPRPPLFPGESGRHRQRAFRDALCDLLPSEHGWLPTLRIGYFETSLWINTHDARARMTALLAAKDVLG